MQYPSVILPDFQPVSAFPDRALKGLYFLHDILFGFLVTPINQAMLQMELITEAETLDLLNRDLLHKEMPNYRKK